MTAVFDAPVFDAPAVENTAAAASTGLHVVIPTRPILTDREIEVLISWIGCDSKTEVARVMFLSLGTVNTHLTRIRAKYAAVGRPAPTKAGLVARALQDGLVHIDDL